MLLLSPHSLKIHGESFCTVYPIGPWLLLSFIAIFLGVYVQEHHLATSVFRCLMSPLCVNCKNVIFHLSRFSCHFLKGACRLQLCAIYSTRGLKQDNLGLSKAQTFISSLQFGLYQCNFNSNT